MEQYAEHICDRIISYAASSSIGEFKPPVSIADRSSLSSIALGISDKPVAEISERQFKVMLGESLARHDWLRARAVADQLRTVYPENMEITCLARYCEALAEAHGKSSEKALAYCEEIVAEYGNTDLIGASRCVARAQMLQARVFNYLGLDADEKLTYKTLIAQHAPSRGDPEIGNLIEVAEENLQSLSLDTDSYVDTSERNRTHKAKPSIKPAVSRKGKGPLRP